MPAARTAATVDPRSPFAVDTRGLGRRAGSMQPWDRVVPAPAGWEMDLAGVPAGHPLGLALRLESVMDGVLVSGEVSTDVRAECGRCLEPVAVSVLAPVQELFSYQPDPDDEDLPVMAGDLIDLEPVIRDAVLLGLPATPLCSQDCLGLCPGCGERLDDLPEDHDHDAVDPRWSALAGLAAATSDPSSPAQRRADVTVGTDPTEES